MIDILILICMLCISVALAAIAILLVYEVTREIYKDLEPYLISLRAKLDL
jgi:hypothetical protein